MFETYDMQQFGEYLKTIRIKSKLTQKDVEERCGINKESIRRIEKGYVIPKFETLVYLTEIYKTNVVKALIDYSQPCNLFNYYTRMDKLIISYSLNDLKNLKKDFISFTTDIDTSTIINKNTYSQFLHTLDGISQYNNGDIDSFDTFFSAIIIATPSFTLKTMQEHAFSTFEMRILMLLGLSLTLKKELTKSNNVLLYCLETLLSDPRPTVNCKNLISKAYFNLAYNYHIIDNHADALKYSKSGISYCVENNILHSLAPLYFRCGSSSYYLNKKDYQHYFYCSLYLLKMTENYELMDIYKTHMINQYGFENLNI